MQIGLRLMIGRTNRALWPTFAPWTVCGKSTRRMSTGSSCSGLLLASFFHLFPPLSTQLSLPIGSLSRGPKSAHLLGLLAAQTGAQWLVFEPESGRQGALGGVALASGHQSAR